MMNCNNGKAMYLEQHVYQCVRKIIFTLIGTRLCRREFGSVIPRLIDEPISTSTLMLIRAGVFLAVKRWEKRLTISSVTFALSTGVVEVFVQGYVNDRAVNWSFAKSDGVMA